MALERPSILFLMADQLRLDHVGFGGGRARTPNIDRIASGAAFVNCTTVNPICTPARAALFTGKYTHQIGMVSMSGDLDLQHPTFPRALREAGYWTCGIGKFHLLQTWRWGTPRGRGIDLRRLRDRTKEYGFDVVWEAAGKQLAVRNYCDYCAYLDERGLLESYRDFVEAAGPNVTSLLDIAKEAANGDASPVPAEEHVDTVVADEIIRALRERPKDRPFFVFGSFLSPHKPYDPPQEYIDAEPSDFHEPSGGRAELDPTTLALLAKQQRSYRALVRFLDDQIGRVLNELERLGLLENTVVLFTTDHGEMLGDHDRVQKMTYHRGALTVPTAVLLPGGRPGVVCDSPVEITDLTATILDCAGIDPAKALSKPWPAFHDRVPCRSLIPILNGSRTSVRDFSFAECNGLWQAIDDGVHKYVRLMDAGDDFPGREELYDLVNDPEETTDLVSAGLRRPGTARSVESVLAVSRERLRRTLERTPSAQLRWAPLPPEGEAFSYPRG